MSTYLGYSIQNKFININNTEYIYSFEEKGNAFMQPNQYFTSVLLSPASQTSFFVKNNIVIIQNYSTWLLYHKSQKLWDSY